MWTGSGICKFDSCCSMDSRTVRPHTDRASQGLKSRRTASPVGQKTDIAESSPNTASRLATLKRSETSYALSLGRPPSIGLRGYSPLQLDAVCNTSTRVRRPMPNGRLGAGRTRALCPPPARETCLSGHGRERSTRCPVLSHETG